MLTDKNSPSRIGLTTRTQIVLLSLAATISLIGFACKDGNGEKTSTPTDEPSTTPTATTTTAPLLSPTVVVADLPEEFPADFPIYPAATIIAGNQQGTNISAIFSTPDPASDLVAFYRESLDKDPWQLVSVTEEENSAFVNFARPDDLSLSGTIFIQAVPEDGARMIIFLPTAGSETDSEGQPP